MSIYTKTGDKGKTSLFGGSRVSKAHARVESHAAIDELNSSLGVTIAHLTAKHTVLIKELKRIQHELFNIGSALAMPHPMPVAGLEKRIESFEKMIDELTIQMPTITYFILPGGSKGAAFLHVSRTLARRAERRVVALLETEAVAEDILKYLNRLSDLLYTMARYANFLDNHPDVKWIKK